MRERRELKWKRDLETREMRCICTHTLKTDLPSRFLERTAGDRNPLPSFQRRILRIHVSPCVMTNPSILDFSRISLLATEGDRLPFWCKWGSIEDSSSLLPFYVAYLLFSKALLSQRKRMRGETSITQESILHRHKTAQTRKNDKMSKDERPSWEEEGERIPYFGCLCYLHLTILVKVKSWDARCICISHTHREKLTILPRDACLDGVCLEWNCILPPSSSLPLLPWERLEEVQKEPEDRNSTRPFRRQCRQEKTKMKVREESKEAFFSILPVLPFPVE